MIPPAVVLYPGESLEVAWYGGGPSLAFTLTELASEGYWIARVSVDQTVLGFSDAGRVVRRLLDHEMAAVRRAKQAATS